MGGLAVRSGDPRRGEKLTQSWLKDPSSVSADAATVAVPLASIRAGAARLEELRAALKSAKSPADRELAIRAMGTFDDPATLRRALDPRADRRAAALGPEYLFGSALGHRAARATVYRWEKDNWEKLRARIPATERASSSASRARCARRASATTPKAFLVPGTRDLEGTKREARGRAGRGAALHRAARARRGRGDRYLRKK